jgi:hypothetical protein
VVGLQVADALALAAQSPATQQPLVGAQEPLPALPQNFWPAPQHWLLVQVMPGPQSVAPIPVVQQPAAPVEATAQVLSALQARCWQLLPGAGQLVVLALVQQPGPVTGVRPQLVPSQLAAWQLEPVGQAVHEVVPQLAVLVLATQTLLQSWKPLTQA